MLKHHFINFECVKSAGVFAFQTHLRSVCKAKSLTITEQLKGASFGSALALSTNIKLRWKACKEGAGLQGPML
jgi:hypothetical protein